MTAPEPGHVEALRSSLAALIEESQSLRADVRTAEQARRRNAAVNTGVLIVFAIVIAMLIGMTAQTNQLAREVRDADGRIVDCSTAGGRCYEDGRARTGQAVNSILLADIYMAECARLRPNESGPAFDAYLEQCVRAKLSAATKQSPSPSPSPS